MKILIAFALYLCITTAQADLFDDAAAAYGRADYAEALKWYRLAAEQGDAFAQYNLALMYNKGQGIPQDYAEALKWHRLAAEQGDAFAQFALGNMYRSGHGVLQDYVEAHKWFNLAASRKTEEDSRKRSIKNRGIVAKLMTPAQVAEAQKLAKQWDKSHPR
jgi:TPR repeat protein